MILPLLLSPAFAETPEDYEQVLPSEQGTLDIGLSVVPEAEANSISKLHIGWIKPGFNKIDLKNELNDLIKAGLSLSAASKYLAKKNQLTKKFIYNLH